MDHTTQADIQRWIEKGQSQSGCTHVIVVCDMFDYEDYPVFVMDNQDVRKIYEKYNGHNMQKVMEVYNLSMDIEKQLNEHRSFNF